MEAKKAREYENVSAQELIARYYDCRALLRMIAGVHVVRTCGFQMLQREFLLASLLLRPGEAELGNSMSPAALHFRRWVQREESIIHDEIKSRCRGKSVGAA